MNGIVRVSFVSVLLLGAVISASSQQQPSKTKEKHFDYDELTKAPEKQRNKANPMEKDPEAVAAGKLLFEEHCGECHGDDAEGSRRAPSLRVKEVQDATPGAIFWVLSNGVVRKRMPVWTKLPEVQRWQLVSFIKSLKEEPAPGQAANATGKN